MMVDNKALSFSGNFMAVHANKAQLVTGLRQAMEQEKIAFIAVKGLHVDVDQPETPSSNKLATYMGYGFSGETALSILTALGILVSPNKKPELIKKDIQDGLAKVFGDTPEGREQFFGVMTQASRHFAKDDPVQVLDIKA